MALVSTDNRHASTPKGSEQHRNAIDATDADEASPRRRQRRANGHGAAARSIQLVSEKVNVAAHTCGVGIACGEAPEGQTPLGSSQLGPEQI